MAQKNKKQAKKEVKNYLDLFYMTPNTIAAKDFAESLSEISTLKVQLWEEFNVLEIELPNENSIDFESIDIRFKDPSDASFIKNRGIQTIFAITLCEQDLELLVSCFDTVIVKHDGFLCADSDDFTPVYAGSSKR